MFMATLDETTLELVDRARRQDVSAVGQLLELHRPRLKRTVAARLDRRMAGRLDASDIVQDAMLDAARRFAEYLAQPEIPFFTWFRSLALSRMIDAHRMHRAGKRDVEREVRDDLPPNDGSLAGLAERLAGRQSSPSAQLMRGEARQHVRQALDQLPTLSRELLVLRYVEGLTPAEAAAVLQISERTLRRRHRDALIQLGQHLESESP